MTRSFRYNTDRKTIVKSVLFLLLIVAGAVLLYVLYTGGAFSAWFLSAVLAVLALMVLSIPQRIVLLDDTLEIQCISDITEINIREIASVRKVEKRDMRWTILLFGASGFFGYYGKFFDLKEFDVVTIYASEWNNFVEITDIYDTRTYISCREADEFIKTVMQAKAEYDELPPEIE
jgi:hypothetical protein